MFFESDDVSSYVLRNKNVSRCRENNADRLTTNIRLPLLLLQNVCTTRLKHRKKTVFYFSSICHELNNNNEDLWLVFVYLFHLTRKT